MLLTVLHNASTTALCAPPWLVVEHSDANEASYEKFVVVFGKVRLQLINHVRAIYHPLSMLIRRLIPFLV